MSQDQETTRHLRVEGMTCQSCELLIEKRWKKLEGVSRVEVNSATGKATVVSQGAEPSIAQLQKVLSDAHYRVFEASEKGESFSSKRPTFWQLVGLFALVFFLGIVLSKIGILKSNVAFGGETSFWTVFVVGLVAASSSCIAISGGLLLSSAATFNERYASRSSASRMRPVALFIGGRLVSYTFLGGLIGLIGKTLSPSPLVTGGVAIVAAIYMLVMGLEMLHLAPRWLKSLMPRMPKGLSHRVLESEAKEHWAAPFLLGGATFFLPCGFTQALQLYALTTGSFWTSASLMLAFALGTAPALSALGWASSSLKGRAGRFFTQFSGALVIVLGLWNIQNGFAIAGHPLVWPDLSGALSSSTPSSETGGASGITFDGQTQVVHMTVGAGGYAPNRFTIRPGLQTRWQIDGTNAAGCASVIQSPSLGVSRTLLSSGENTITFISPTQPGTYPFSCSMGMYRGEFTVSNS